MQRITKNPETRRQEIIDAAIGLFVEKGYEHTSMLDITKEINVSQGLCYRYFKSKEEIYQAALNLYVEQGVDCFNAMMQNKNCSLFELIDTLPALHDMVIEDNQYHKFFNSPGNSNFHLQMEIALINELIPILTERLESAKENREINIENSTLLATFFFYGQLGIWQRGDIENKEKIKYIREYARALLERN
ncbi:TetR/AcrR family transcriptional regulator [Hespellia stercorisuis]|uniref:Transcriptional regulator, TetR family n=1 Tax=Hespellia stercorisuis DSM 15480 TaxID=1121950 RepID=A0A1M6QQQ2_9FIRM|nr:TetR/AcrR family transcriptional regulator [Hespellia stercorisuis]SHK22581.1 transcriptional regulator, TetR family [Hespellia stercorisuis DSM 15480]